MKSSIIKNTPFQRSYVSAVPLLSRIPSTLHLSILFYTLGPNSSKDFPFSISSPKLGEEDFLSKLTHDQLFIFSVWNKNVIFYPSSSRYWYLAEKVKWVNFSLRDVLVQCTYIHQRQLCPNLLNIEAIYICNDFLLQTGT